MLSGAVRARRPPSPPPSYHQSVPRFPPKEGHLDADERRAAASLGYGPSRKSAHAYGGYNITPGEWKLLLVLVVIASAVRLFRISKPDSVVYAILLLYQSTVRRADQSRTLKIPDSMKSILASSPRDISRHDISWTFTPHWPNYSSPLLLSCQGLMDTLTSQRLQSRFLRRFKGTCPNRLVFFLGHTKTRHTWLCVWSRRPSGSLRFLLRT
jgi:dolichyl-phosphate-mannose-protein mannosyltransferase